MNDQARESYRHCRRIARNASSSFYWTFRLLPPRQREAMCALYAFSRHTDDLGDSTQPAARRREQLEQWQNRVNRTLAGDSANSQPAYSTPSTGPKTGRETARGAAILPALRDTVERYGIPPDYLLDIIRGVMMDLEPRRFETMDELNVYCYRVASCVGLACTHIWGFRDPAVKQPATTCGIAFQMTNILRDLREDALRDRVYLPGEDLRRFGVTLPDLQRGAADERLEGLLRFEVERTERLYGEAAAAGEFLEPAGRRMFSMMFATYRGLLEQIGRRGGQALDQRVGLPMGRKLMIAVRHAWPWLPGGRASTAPSWKVAGS